MRLRLANVRSPCGQSPRHFGWTVNTAI
jgi:hypothetical protein